MAEILTTNFKTDTTRLFVDDVLNNDYYFFVSSIERLNSDNHLKATNEFIEKALFGKQILNQDVFFMIKYYPWQKDDVYVQYDDAADLEEQKFYSVVGPNNNDTGDYRVYKCLFNNDGAKVSSPPNFNEDTNDQIYRTADGYVWKYMYAISEIEFEAYNAIGYIPIIGSFDTDPTYTSGGSELASIFVENPNENLGYSFEYGSMNGTPSVSGELSIVPSEVSDWSEIEGYYVGQSIYLTNPNGVSFLYEITYYRYNDGPGTVTIRVDGDPRADGVASNAGLNVFPRIEILGDGNGAQAIPVINSTGRITSITVLNKGTGYNNISVRVVDPLFDFTPDDPNDTDARAEIRGILSPKDGHGYNLIDEFKCKHFLLYGYITTEDNASIGATNTYSTIGVVKNPEFANTSPVVFDNRIAITTDDVTKVEVNSTITQVNADNEIVFSGIVHEVDGSSNTIYIAEYNGPYENVANSDISLDSSLQFRNETGQTIEINTPVDENIITPEYIQRTGKVYFMEDFFPLARNDLSREEFKIVLEF